MGKKFKFTGGGGGGDSTSKTSVSSPSIPSSPSAPSAPASGKFQFKSGGSSSGISRPPSGPITTTGEEAASVRETGESAFPQEYFIADDQKLSEAINRRLAISQDSAAKVGESGIDLNSFTAVDGDYLQSLSEQTGFRLLNLADQKRPTNDVVRLLTAEQAKRLMAVPVGLNEEGVVIIAIADPPNTTVTDDLHAIVGREIEPVIAAAHDIKERIEQYYGLGDETLDDIVAKDEEPEEVMATANTGVTEVDLTDVNALINAPPVIKLVNALLAKAVHERASDIHIEPFANVIRIRYRVDGVLREIPSPPRNMLSGLVSRIKVLANMNISESRLPQDGRVKLVVEGREVDLRCSTMPTSHGEAIVMRVLDKNMMMIGISQIGMSEEMLSRFMKHLEKPNGIVLVTGPTGCGKTTTLYAALAEIKDPGDKLITVEDPVEYELPGIVQVNINENVGLTFAKALRSILRQDPDTVLVGEIRDVETAQIAVQASLTGHLVFSTLHTNSAAATVTRLVDMGVEPFLITSSVQAVIGQRLVRTVCPTCRVPYRPTPDELEEFEVTAEDIRDKTFYHGEGCHDCGHSGYKGRMGIFELLEITDEIRDMILDHAGTDEIQEVAHRNGMITMRKDGWLKVCLGLTTFEEVARETPRDSVHKAYEESSGESEGESVAGATAESPKPLAQSSGSSTLEPPKPQLTVAGTSVENEAAARVLDRITKLKI